MSDWTPVLTRKQAKQAAAMKRQEDERIHWLDRFLESAVALVRKQGVDFASLGDSDIFSKTHGQLKPVSVNWPEVKVNPASPLLSEKIGSTNGKDLIKNFYYLRDFGKLVKLVSNFPNPIYHIDYDVYEDMGYCDSYEGRIPYTDSISVRIWTYAADNVPVSYTYDMDVDVSPKMQNSVNCCYSYASSPVDVAAGMQENGYIDFNLPEDYADCAVRMMELCNQ
jgi:hypothetical protein